MDHGQYGERYHLYLLKIIEDEFNIDPHTLSAIWYGLDDYEVSNLKGGGLKNFKR